MRPLITVLLILLLSNSPKLGAQNEELDNILTGIELRNASISYVAYNTDKDQELISINKNKQLQPASIVKVLTTNIAIELLGEDYTFNTNIGIRGEIRDEILQGDLIILGGGDPTLGFNIKTGKSIFPNDFFAFVKQILSEYEIEEINGSVILDISHFAPQYVPDGWLWADIGNYYGAGSFGMNYLGNRYSLFFRSGKSVGAPTEIIDIFPRINLEIKNKVISKDISNDQAYLYGGPFQENILANGAIPLNRTRFEVKGSLPDPPKYFLEDLREQFSSWKINVKGDFKVSSESIDSDLVLQEYQSPPLTDIVAYTNRKSDNFFAETILKEIGYVNGEGSTTKGLEVLFEYFDQNSLGTLELTDGSGLSRTNRISAGQFVKYLIRNVRNCERNFASYGLSIAGKSGSMKKIGLGTCYEGKLMAKSGYMKGVRSYAGMYLNEDNERLIFCIIVNDHNCSAARARQLIQEILTVTLCE